MAIRAYIFPSLQGACFVKMNTRSSSVLCPNCGAPIICGSSGYAQINCSYCGSTVQLTPAMQNITVSVSEDFRSFSPGQIIQRVGRLFYLAKYDQAKILLDKALLTYPAHPRLSELENQCDCFMTRNIGQYFHMLSVRSFLTDDECARYKIEIDGFCKMVGNSAINSLNTPLERKQNAGNYEAILYYIANLKKCLANDAVIRNDLLYESVKNAVLKLSAIICNTIYRINSRKPYRYRMLITYKYRRYLKADFTTIDPAGETPYRIVDESEIRKYIPGGDYE